MESQEIPSQPPALRQSYEHMAETFSDVFGTHINPWSVAITFGTRATQESEPTTWTHRMRMSPQQAKALAVMLLRDIRGYESRTDSEITLPIEVLNALNIPIEDWKRFSVM